MKKHFMMALILLSVCMSDFAEAAKVKATASTKGKATGSKAQLGTSFKFDGSSLRGKYQSSLGTNATVENDKYLDDLLGGRKKFDDRLAEEKTRN